MININQSQIDFIENVVKTAQTVKIDNVIVEPDCVRAIDDARSVVLFHNNDVPEMPFGSIGLNRIGDFRSRLEIVKTQNNFAISVLVDKDDEYARSIIMKSTGTKIDYRCANPATVQAPRQINDNLIYRIQLNPEAVSLMQKGQAAMGSEIVTILGGDGVSFELTDINSDVFKHDIAPDFEMLSEDAAETFSHNYPVKILLALFKQNPDGYFDIGEKGILNINVNGLELYVLPKV